MSLTFSGAQGFNEGAVIIIDKPLGWTSFDVVKKIKFNLRKYYGFKKIKVGHAGTLDPLATGVLVVCTGRMTKQIDGLMSEGKEYTGSIKFGVTTPSFDAETEEEGNFDTSHLNLELLRESTSHFKGEILQVPPIYSAKKIDGKRAYDHARGGTEVKMRTNLVQVDVFEILSFEDNVAEFRIRCGKGTYIRSLANDLGKHLKSGAYLTSLRRTESGKFKASEAFSIDDIINYFEEDSAKSKS
jgi:tRNA pseudouridine55 synthase